MKSEHSAAGDAWLDALAKALACSRPTNQPRTLPDDGADGLRTALVEVRFEDGDGDGHRDGDGDGDGVTIVDLRLRAVATPARASSAVSERERDVLVLLADGATTTTIGRALGISEPTVQKHVASMKAKLGAATRAHLVAIGIRSGLIP
jgi:DNA-binding CsgD family transcriptional regulator